MRDTTTATATTTTTWCTLLSRHHLHHLLLGLLLLLLLLPPHPAAAASTPLPLFPPWRAADWTASDDSTVRGGASQSYLQILPGLNNNNASSSSEEAEAEARFHGTLDDQALGGARAGFASQRTADAWPGVDLSPYDRVVLEVLAAAGGEDMTTSSNKTYSFNLKDTIPETLNGVEQAGVSWEYNFRVAARTSGSGTTETETDPTYEQVEVLFADLVPTYRGSVVNDTTPLNLTGIKRVNLMIRRWVFSAFDDFLLLIDNRTFFFFSSQGTIRD